MELIDQEKTIVAVVRFNKQEARSEICKTWTTRWFEVAFKWRSPKCVWGRFGGGWQWAVGFQASGKTLILSLLVCTLRFTRK